MSNLKISNNVSPGDTIFDPAPNLSRDAYACLLDFDSGEFSSSGANERSGTIHDHVTYICSSSNNLKVDQKRFFRKNER